MGEAALTFSQAGIREESSFPGSEEFVCGGMLRRTLKLKYHFGLRHGRSLSDPFCTNLGPKGSNIGDPGLVNITSEFQT